MRIYLFILLGVIMVVFIRFLLKANGNRWMRNYGFRLYTNNNTQAGLCWIITSMVFTCLLLVCTQGSSWPIGLDISTPHYSERTEKFLKLYEQTIAERGLARHAVKGVVQDVSAATSKALEHTHYAACSFLGYTVFFLFIFSAFYTVIAFSDEFMSAWENTKDKVFGRRSGEQNLPDVRQETSIPPPIQIQSEQNNQLGGSITRRPLRFLDYITYEFIFGLIGQLANTLLHRRG